MAFKTVRGSAMPLTAADNKLFRLFRIVRGSKIEVIRRSRSEIELRNIKK